MSRAGAKKVLIVEDEAISAMYLKMELSDRGFRVLKPAATGEQAVNAALKQRPEVIIMDINLPGKMNGLETAAAVMARYSPLVIFITGFDSDELAARMASLSSVGYVTKPISTEGIEEIVEKIRRHLPDGMPGEKGDGTCRSRKK